MLITFNCALDMYVWKGDIAGANLLFNEIDSIFGADIISYSTLIKGLCQADKKIEAFEYIKRLLSTSLPSDISVINLFLDSCAN